ncbi:MAG: sdaAB [Bacillales bacterium]|jgi:L-serine dehydratase|nr:sdaAB [Bacillales bacterium]
MKYRSVSDIIGPIMIGPSSSHTAGAARIGANARSLFGKQPSHVKIIFYGSFAKTYKGHGTDVAIIAGLLGCDTFDPRIVEAYELAKEHNLQIEIIESEMHAPHPNTARIEMTDGTSNLEVVGISIGGGVIEIIEINGFPLKISGDSPTLIIIHEERYGAIASVATMLANNQINIGHMEVSRKERGKEALMVIEVDQRIDNQLIEDLSKLDHVITITKMGV